MRVIYLAFVGSPRKHILRVIKVAYLFCRNYRSKQTHWASRIHPTYRVDFFELVYDDGGGVSVQAHDNYQILNGLGVLHSKKNVHLSKGMVI